MRRVMIRTTQDNILTEISVSSSALICAGVGLNLGILGAVPSFPVPPSPLIAFQSSSIFCLRRLMTSCRLPAFSSLSFLLSSTSSLRFFSSTAGAQMHSTEVLGSLDRPHNGVTKLTDAQHITYLLCDCRDYGRRNWRPQRFRKLHQPGP